MPYNRADFEGHTPGPWRLRYDGNGCKEIEAPQGSEGVDPGETIFGVRGYTYGLCIESEDTANAHLIAAAPEVLADLDASRAECAALRESLKRKARERNALLDGLRRVRDALPDSDGTGAAQERADCVAYIDAAISRAVKAWTGEDQEASEAECKELRRKVGTLAGIVSRVRIRVGLSLPNARRLIHRNPLDGDASIVKERLDEIERDCEDQEADDA